jgi:hypothetical protein
VTAGLADIALLEIIHDKIGFELPEVTAAKEEKPKKRRRSS